MISIKPISAKTRLCVLLGDPVDHSLSPLIHNRWYKEQAIDAVYLALPVKRGHVKETLKTLAMAGAIGANITVPHKLEALKACDNLTTEAQQVGAVNSVLFQGSNITGDNTDAKGFLQDMHKHCPSPSFKKVCLWGAGGAAQAILFTLKNLGAKEVLIINRTQSKSENLVRSFRLNEKESKEESMTLRSAAEWHEKRNFVSTSNLFINASAQGMKGIVRDDNYFPDFASVVTNATSSFPERVAYDLVYNPTRTEFLERARKAHIKTLSGIGMLVCQAAVSFEKWFGIIPDVSDDLLRTLTTTLEKS